MVMAATALSCVGEMPSGNFLHDSLFLQEATASGRADLNPLKDTVHADSSSPQRVFYANVHHKTGRA
jgi:hypothetical protein